MARLSKEQRISAICAANPLLQRGDPRIRQLIEAETHLQRCERAAKKAPLTVPTRGGGSRRSPEVVALESASREVRRISAELGIDRVGVSKAVEAGVKRKRSGKVPELIKTHFVDGNWADSVSLIPGVTALLAAYGVEAEDVPEQWRSLWVSQLAVEQGDVERIRADLKRDGML